MTYSVWETDSANILGTFSTEADALALVRSVVESTGAEYIESLTLTSMADDGSVEGVAAGTELVGWARQQDELGRWLA